MPDPLSRATAAVWDHLSSFPATKDTVVENRERWHQFASAERVRVVVFGAYDAGKTTMLKRLLVEAGVPVPSWMTISARRETFEVSEVVVGDLVVADTPGQKAGNDVHEEVSRRAMQLADAYLWVMPPQLVTSGQADFLEFLSGNFFHEKLPRNTVVDATLAVIGRMDEAGVDPADSPDGFRNLASSKVAELQALLRKGEIQSELLGIFCIAADAYQFVGNEPCPALDQYAPSRDWDGISALKAALDQVAVARTRLRALAGLRFVGVVTREFEHELEERRSIMTLRAERLALEEERLRLFRKLVSAQRSYAHKDLRRRVDGVLLSIARFGAEDAARAADRLEAALKHEIDQWAAENGLEFGKLAEKLGTELDEHPIEVDLLELRKLSQAGVDATSTDRTGTNFKAAKSRLLGFGPVLRNAFDGYVWSRLGMSVENASKKLQELDGLEGDGLAKAIRRLFQTEERMREASKFVTWGEVATTAGPAITMMAELGIEVATHFYSEREAADRKKRYDELLATLNKASMSIAEQAMAAFEAMPTQLDELLATPMKAAGDIRSEMLRQIAEIDAFLDELRTRLDVLSASEAAEGF